MPNPLFKHTLNLREGRVRYGDIAGTPTSLPPTGAAGGDLVGSTYPNPTIAPGVVTRAKLAAGAPIGNGSTVPVTGFSTATTGSYIKVVDLPSLTVRGGLVFLFAPHGLFYTNAGAGLNDVWLKFVRDGTTDVTVVTWRFGVAGTHPVPPHVALDGPAAGAHVYSLYVQLTGSGGSTITSNTGLVVAWEVS